jgi:tetratricopeptide (TPR) repeat protein
VLAIVATLGTPAVAQTYPSPTDAPHTTDLRALRHLAIEREIHERFVRGLAAEGRSDWAAASVEFTRIIALDPPEPKASTARYDLAIAKAQLGDYSGAKALLEDALRRDPGFGAAAANLVTVNALAGDLAGARAAADRFVALVPASARAHYDRGIVALRAGDLATARTDFDALIAGDPTYAVAYYDLALVEIRSGKFDAAELELEHALALAPGYARARFALGTVYVRTGRNAAARAAFDRVARDASDITLRTLALSLRDQHLSRTEPLHPRSEPAVNFVRGPGRHGKDACQSALRIDEVDGRRMDCHTNVRDAECLQEGKHIGRCARRHTPLRRAGLQATRMTRHHERRVVLRIERNRNELRVLMPSRELREHGVGDRTGIGAARCDERHDRRLAA